MYKECNKNFSCDYLGCFVAIFGNDKNVIVKNA